MGAYKLLIETYCQDCPEFEVVDLREDIYSEDFMSEEPDRAIFHVIKCKHSRRCANMVNWLRKNKEKEINDGCTEN